MDDTDIHREPERKSLESNKDPGIDDETLERKHFQNVVNTYLAYKMHGLSKLFKSTKYISTLPAYQQKLLKDHTMNLFRVKNGISRNQEVIELILKDVSYIFENSELYQDVDSYKFHVVESDMEKVHCVFKQLHREWSNEAKDERDGSFKIILDELCHRFPNKAESVTVLVPGAGLGRLPYEIAKKGFSCQGNEFSLFMLFASNFVLNKCQGINLHKVYPWLHQSNNHLSSESRLSSFMFPDVDPSDLPSDSNFSMAAGNFIEIYQKKASWDCVVTCFFLDTAHNVITYIETIWKILKRGGIWINLGPLLYHHADLPDVDSIEPSYEEVKNIVLGIGFHYLKEQTGVSAPYCQNPNSMLNFSYKSVFFVCQKPVKTC